MADFLRNRFHEILARFETAMLVTKTPAGVLRARPMAVAQCDSDDDLWFVADAESGKIDELIDNPQVAVTCQAEARYLSLSGTAKLSRDRSKIESLWQESWLAWFPAGVDDSNLVLIHVDGTEGEFWDSGELKGAQYRFAAEETQASNSGVGNARHGSVNLQDSQ